MKREINISNEKKTPFELTIFSEFLDEKNTFLSVCDLFWINFSESDVIFKKFINSICNFSLI